MRGQNISSCHLLLLLLFCVIVIVAVAVVQGGGDGGGHGANVVDVAAVVVLSGQPGEHVAVHPLQPSPKQSPDQRPEETDRDPPFSSS